MERILLRNGIPEPMPRIEGTYLYQTLHVRGRRPLWLDRHTELLARNIQEPVSYTHLRAHETPHSISYAVFCLTL